MSPIRARRFASIIRPLPPSAARCSIRTTISRSSIFCGRRRPQAACSSMSGPMSAPMPWCWRVTSAQDASKSPPSRLAFTRAASGTTHVALVAAAAGPSDVELMIETDGDNLGASHVVSDQRAGNAIKVPSLRLQRILGDGDVDHVDALKIDVEGFEDRVLTTFFKQAPPSLWPRAVVIEHLSRSEWQDDCIADMQARGYAEAGKTRSNTLLIKQ